jgi:hypothetical protein
MRTTIKTLLREGLYPHEIKSELHWQQVLKDSPYALKVLKTVMTKQNGFASDKQMAIMKRAKGGNQTTYSRKN